MKIQVTAPGIYNSKGEEIPVGTELDVKTEPTGWAGRYTVIGGKGAAEKVAVTNPDDSPKTKAEPKAEPEKAPEKPAPVGPFTVKDASPGWYAIVDGAGATVGKNVRKADAEAFGALSDEDKAAFAAEHAKD